MNLKTGKIEMTSQNHSYAVDEDSLAGTGLTVTHRGRRTAPTYSRNFCRA